MEGFLIALLIVLLILMLGDRIDPFLKSSQSKSIFWIIIIVLLILWIVAGRPLI